MATNRANGYIHFAKFCVSAKIKPIEEFTIQPGSAFIGKQIKDSGLRQKYNTIVIAIKRQEEMFFNPAPDFMIDANDILILVGEKEKLLALG